MIPNATPTILVDIDPRISEETILERCHADPEEEEGERVLELLHEACHIVRPKAILREVLVEPIDEQSVRVGGQVIVSPFVREKLLQAPVAYAYVATCGREIAEWTASLPDFVDRFYLDEMMKAWLGNAGTALRENVQKRVAPDVKLSSLNPGSIKIWPIEGQRELFAMLGNVEGSIGVRLLDSCLMMPAKSGSGILFQDHTGHVNCAYCPRTDCPNRRAPQVSSL